MLRSVSKVPEAVSLITNIIDVSAACGFKIIWFVNRKELLLSTPKADNRESIN